MGMQPLIGEVIKTTIPDIKINVGSNLLSVKIVVTEEGSLILDGIGDVDVTIHRDRLIFMEKNNVRDKEKNINENSPILDDPHEIMIEDGLSVLTEQNKVKVIDISKHKKYKLDGVFREYRDKYEYVLLQDYEDILDVCMVHYIPIGDIGIQLLEPLDYIGIDNIYLASIEFLKDRFTLHAALDWLKVYNVTIPCIEKEDKYIYHANEVIEGLLFKGIPIVLFEKGRKKVKCEDSYMEITKEYVPIKNLSNTKESKILKFQSTKKPSVFKFDGNKNYDRKIVYNDMEIDHIPVLNFDLTKDLVISNGNVVVCDYIAPYGETIGFYQGKYEEGTDPLPVSFLLDMDTPIYMSVEIKPDGGKLCIIQYNYIIDDRYRC